MSTAPYHPVVFGPYKSRRFGQSLGINLAPSPREDCPKDCVYCEGPDSSGPIINRISQAPSAGVIVTSAARRIIEMSKGGDKLAGITISGNNEPTMHAALLEITDNLRALRNKWYPKAKLSILSNHPCLETPDLVHALEIYDQPVVRFEWGSAKTFTAMTKRPGTELKELIEFLSGLERLVVQASFVQGGPENSTDKEVKSWIRKISEIAPTEIQVLTIPDPGRGKKPRPVTDAKLKTIATQVHEATEIPTTAYSAAGKLA